MSIVCFLDLKKKNAKYIVQGSLPGKRQGKLRGVLVKREGESRCDGADSRWRNRQIKSYGERTIEKLFARDAKKNH